MPNNSNVQAGASSSRDSSIYTQNPTNLHRTVDNEKYSTA